MTKSSTTEKSVPAETDPTHPHRYDAAMARVLEKRWQTFWQEDRTYATPNPGEPGFDTGREKFYCLDMFPYPSGVGLHVGHPLGYIATDILCRFHRMRGACVLHPMGFDAFGLPAEQFAVEHGVHPRITTESNIENMVRQLRRLGLSYDWDRRLATTDASYYRWTQWIFLQLYKSYCETESGTARPIEDLLRKLESGAYVVAADDRAAPSADAPAGTAWADVDGAQRRRVISNHRLAYLAEAPVNWCPALGTVLANEEVTSDGRSDRGNHPVFKRPLRQWMLRITAFAERLADDLTLLDWPEPIKLMQRNWIGRSTGATVSFEVEGHDESISVFTTRPDTLFGATYMVLAPEHALLDTITTDGQRAAVEAYRREAERRSDIDRMAETRSKTGVSTGASAINPATGESIPIWIADYVLMGYGTGAIMAVPAHDERDWAFAVQFDLDIRIVVEPPAGYEHTPTESAAATERDGRSIMPFSGVGTGCNSSNTGVSLDGAETPEAERRIIDWLVAEGIGRATVQYKLRDWLFSRQRYWGEPFPILHGANGELIAIDEGDLPVELPEMSNFSPTISDPDDPTPPRPPLSRAPESWRVVERDGKRYERELNTMPQWAGSCWYYLRFLDPHNQESLVSREAERYWMGDRGIDLYVGGAEHAVLHLLYARFWHKVLFDLGHVGTPEPFGRLFNQGYIQAFAYRDQRGVAVPAEEVVNQDGAPATESQDQTGASFFHGGEPVTREYGKMGKSLKNATSPDEVCERYGCDTLRLYEMYMGPLDASKPWNPRDIVGPYRFLQRVWRLAIDEQTGTVRLAASADADVERALHRTIARVGGDIERLAFNTAIAGLIEFLNAALGQGLTRDQLERFVLVLAPFAPHIAEELWSRLGHETSLANGPWPPHDESILLDAEIEMPVQIMGKVRAKVRVPADADAEQIEMIVLADEKVQAQLSGRTIRKVIVVPGKIVNLVI